MVSKRLALLASIPEAWVCFLGMGWIFEDVQTWLFTMDGSVTISMWSGVNSCGGLKVSTACFQARGLSQFQRRVWICQDVQTGRFTVGGSVTINMWSGVNSLDRPMASWNIHSPCGIKLQDRTINQTKCGCGSIKCASLSCSCQKKVHRNVYMQNKWKFPNINLTLWSIEWYMFLYQICHVDIYKITYLSLWLCMCSDRMFGLESDLVMFNLMIIYYLYFLGLIQQGCCITHIVKLKIKNKWNTRVIPWQLSCFSSVPDIKSSIK